MAVKRVCDYCFRYAKWITELVTGELLCDSHAKEHSEITDVQELAEHYYRLTDKRLADYLAARS